MATFADQKPSISPPATDYPTKWNAMCDMLDAIFAGMSPCQGRLTLATGTPVTTADQTASTTLYFTPHKGNAITLYDGSSLWTVLEFAEASIAVPATTNQMYDVFAYNNSGTIALELLAWTNDTTRATALTKQNGVLVKTGATTRRYLGSFRTTGSSGQTEDSAAKRYLWNYYNRVARRMQAALETTDSWNYTTAAFRQANANTANQLECVVGVAEDTVSVAVIAAAKNSAGDTTLGVGIGVDSTSVNSAQLMSPLTSTAQANYIPLRAEYRAPLIAGRHALVWLEYSAAAGTTTWIGDGNSPTTCQSGIFGEVWA